MSDRLVIVIGLLGYTQYSMSATMKLTPTETELIGGWEMVVGRVRADGTCERMNGWLEAISRRSRRVTGKLYLETQMTAAIGSEPTL